MFLFKKVINAGLVLSVFFYFCSFAFAQGNLHIGALEIHPFASLEQKYNDNIFLEQDNQENDDWITTTTLGFGLKMPLVAQREEDFLLKAEYAADIIEFWDYSGQSRIDHSISTTADFLFANDVTFKLKDNFKKTADPATSELTALEKRLRNTVEAVLGYKREKIGVDLGYTNIREDYDALDSLDKYEHVLTATGYYELFPKTSILCEYNFGQIIYDDNATNSDSEYNQWRIGLEGEIASKLTGVVKAGFKSTSYDDASRSDFNGFTLFANLTYKMRERSTLNIYGERESVESTYRTLSHYESNKIGLTLDHQLLERLFLVLADSYQFNKYPDETTENSLTAKRKDTIWDGKIGLRYEIKDWLHMETGYEYKQRDSKFATFDYKNNIFSVKATFVF